MSADDLSGEWRGVFNYPGGAAPPTGFNATLRDAGGLLTGETTEPGLHGSTLSARLDGRRTGTALVFNKLYDDAGGGVGDYDSVAYRGEVDGEGLEITGRWTIPGAWSGSFIMVRERGAETAADLQAEQEAGRLEPAAPRQIGSRSSCLLIEGVKVRANSLMVSHRATTHANILRT